MVTFDRQRLSGHPWRRAQARTVLPLAVYVPNDLLLRSMPFDDSAAGKLGQQFLHE